MENRTESVFETLSLNGAGMSVCPNGLTVVALFPAGTREAHRTNRSGCFFYVRIPATSLSKSVNRCTLSKQETTRFQRFATFRNLTVPSSLHLMDIVPDRFEHIHLRVNVQANVLFECGQIFMTREGHNYPFT